MAISTWRCRHRLNPSPIFSDGEMEEFEGSCSDLRSDCSSKYEVEEEEDGICQWDPDSESYICKICPATMNSEQSYHMHRGGQKHQKKLATYRLLNEKDAPAFVESKSCGNKLQEIYKGGGTQLTFPTKILNIEPKIKRALERIEDPVIGLEYLVEVLLRDNMNHPVYRCSLCPAVCQAISVPGHVTGFKHRMAYFKEHCPDIYAELDEMSNRSTQVKLAKYYARRFEKKNGRGNITVEVEVDSDTKGFEDIETNTPLTKAETNSIIKATKSFDKAQKLDFLMYACSNLLEDEFKNPALSKRQLKHLYCIASKVKNQCKKYELASFHNSEIQNIAENIAKKHVRNEVLSELFPLSETNVGEALIDVLEMMRKGRELSSD